MRKMLCLSILVAGCGIELPTKKITLWSDGKPIKEYRAKWVDSADGAYRFWDENGKWTEVRGVVSVETE